MSRTENFPDADNEESYDRMTGRLLCNQYGYVCEQCLDCIMESDCWCPCHYGTPLYMPHKRLDTPDVAHGCQTVEQTAEFDKTWEDAKLMEEQEDE